jgi:NIPSNAP
MRMLSIVIAGCLLAPAAADDKETRVYEMRTYHAAPGKLDDLHKRFRDHTCKLFEKHGITNVGYWVPVDNKDNKLIFVLSYPSREAREKAWKAFLADPDWQKAYKDSEAAGKLVQKVENVFLTRTDYSPQPKPDRAGERVFELRTYTASDGNLAALNARFRDHTLKLFEKHGMTNVVYWDLMKDQKEADVKLIYLLAHKSLDAARASFDAFRKDPDWVKARTESETKAGGSLTAKEGVKSEFLKATDYSPIK